MNVFQEVQVLWMEDERAWGEHGMLRGSCVLNAQKCSKKVALAAANIIWEDDGAD